MSFPCKSHDFPKNDCKECFSILFIAYRAPSPVVLSEKEKDALEWADLVRKLMASQGKS